MCRNIKTLYNFEPATSHDEIRNASLQFVRKVSGFTKPSKANEVAFNHAIDEVSEAIHELLHSLVTNSPPRDRDVETAKLRARSGAVLQISAPGTGFPSSPTTAISMLAGLASRISTGSGSPSPRSILAQPPKRPGALPLSM